MPLPDVEGGRHLSLLRAVADQPGVTAAAERQREGVEQDRLTRAGLAGKRGQTTIKPDIELIDKDNVANRKSAEHVDIHSALDVNKLATPG